MMNTWYLSIVLHNNASILVVWWCSSLIHILIIANIQLFSFNRVGVVFCGRQSPGGHNVIWGLLNALKIHNPNSTLIGFLGKPYSLFWVCI